VNWTELTSIGQLDRLVADSSLAFAIFKHSKRCSISSMVRERLERKWSPEAPFPVLYLDLLKHRDISDYIASRFGVEHESPQLLVIREGKVVYHESHYAISPGEAAAQA
jgi:bacillithiol system protein YtxJ